MNTQQIVCILGMHRSGTSLITRILNLLGVYLGPNEKLLGPDKDNPKGYWEHKLLSYLGEEVLLRLGGNHIELPNFSSGWESDPKLADLRKKARAIIDEDFSSAPVWGWKDPRTCLLLPFWRQIVHPTHYVICLRNPVSVARSLEKRNHISFEQGVHLWLVHTRFALEHTRGLKRIFVFYEDVLNNWEQELLRLALFLEKTEALKNEKIRASIKEFIDQELQHHRASIIDTADDPCLGFPAKALYMALKLYVSGTPTPTQNASIIEAALDSFGIYALESQKRLNDLDRRLVEQQEQVQALRAELLAKEQQIEVLQREVAEKEQRITTLTTQATALLESQKRLNDLDRRLVEQQEQVQALRAELLAKEQQIEVLQREVAEKEQRITTLTTQATALEEKLRIIYNARLFRPVQWLWEFKARISSLRKRSMLFALARWLYKCLPQRFQPFAKAFYLKVRGWRFHTPLRHNNSPVSPSIGNYGVGEKEKVSVIIICTSTKAEFCKAAVESVLMQTYRNFELLIVGNEALWHKNDMQNLLSGILTDPRVIILSCSQELSWSKALNIGLNAMTGEYVTWIFDQDIMHPQQLFVQVKYLQNNPKVSLVYADYEVISSTGLRPVHLMSESATSPRWVSPCFLMRSWLYTLLGPVNESVQFPEDNYWRCIQENFIVAHIGSSQLLYRTHNCERFEPTAKENKMHPALRKPTIMQLFRQKNLKVKIYCSQQVQQIIGSLLWKDTANHYQLSDLNKLEIEPSDANIVKVLLLLESNSDIKFISHYRKREGIVIGLVLKENSFLPYDLPKRIREIIDIVFVTDVKTLARAKLFFKSILMVKSLHEAAKLLTIKARNLAQFVSSQDGALSIAYPCLGKKDKVRVALQVNNLDKGGLEKVVYDLATHLNSDKFQVEVLALHSEGWIAQRLKEKGISVTCLGREDPYLYQQFLRERRIDLINAHYSYFGCDIAAREKVPVVQTLHNTYVWWTDQEIEQHVAHYDPHIARHIAISNPVALYADKVLGIAPEKLCKIPNGLNYKEIEILIAKHNINLRQELKLSERDFLFINPATFYSHKAQLMIVHALKALVSQYPAIKVAFLGHVADEAYYQLVQRFVKENGLQAYVRFCGFREDAYAFYQAADAFLLPSYWEGWSMALAEALYFQLPSIVTDVGSARELVLENNLGIVIENVIDLKQQLDFIQLKPQLYNVFPEFVERLATAMKDLYLQRDIWRARAKSGREIMLQHYSIEQTVSRYEKLFLDLVRQRCSL